MDNLDDVAIDFTPPPFNLQIMNNRNECVLRIFESADGKLDVEADPADYTESAYQFINALKVVARGTQWP
jgi:hypothetical protein